MKRTCRTARALLCVLPAALLFAACLDGGTAPLTELPQCSVARLDTTTWVRIEDTVQFGMLSSATVSFLLPPQFVKIAPHTWERGGTRIHWMPVVADRVDKVFPDMIHSGSCQSNIAGARVYIDYGTLPTGGTPQAVMVATWPTMQFRGTAGTLIFDARMVDHSDVRLFETLLFSIRVPGGPASGLRE